MATNIPEDQTFVGVVIDHISAHHYVVQYFGGYLEARIWPGAITQPKIGDNVIVKPFPNAGYNLIISGPATPLAPSAIFFSFDELYQAYSTFDFDNNEFQSPPNEQATLMADVLDWDIAIGWNNPGTDPQEIFPASYLVIKDGTSYFLSPAEAFFGYSTTNGELWRSYDGLASAPTRIGPTASWPYGTADISFSNTTYGISAFALAPNGDLWFVRSLSASTQDGDDVNYPLEVYRSHDMGNSYTLMYTAKGFTINTLDNNGTSLWPNCSVDPVSCNSGVTQDGNKVSSDAVNMTISDDGQKIVILCKWSPGFGIYQIGSTSLIRSLDGGSTWSELSNWMGSPVTDPDSPRGQGGAPPTGNGTMPWDFVGGIPGYANNIQFIGDRLVLQHGDMSSLEGYFVYYDAFQPLPGIHISEDYGETWSEATLPDGKTCFQYFNEGGTSPITANRFQYNLPGKAPLFQGRRKPSWGLLSYVTVAEMTANGSRGSGRVLRTLDGGLTWDEIPLPIPFTAQVNDTASDYDPYSDTFFMVSVNGGGGAVKELECVTITNFSTSNPSVSRFNDTSSLSKYLSVFNDQRHFLAFPY